MEGWCLQLLALSLLQDSLLKGVCAHAGVCMYVWRRGEVVSKPSHELFSSAAGGRFLPGGVPTRWGQPSSCPVLPQAARPLACFMHAAPCWQAGQLGSSPAPLPCFGASHTLTPWLQALKKKIKKNLRSLQKFIASLPCLMQRRQSMGLLGPCPSCSGEVWMCVAPCTLLGSGCGHRSGLGRCCSRSCLGKGGGPAFVPVPGQWPCSC